MNARLSAAMMPPRKKKQKRRFVSGIWLYIVVTFAAINGLLVWFRRVVLPTSSSRSHTMAVIPSYHSASLHSNYPIWEPRHLTFAQEDFSVKQRLSSALNNDVWHASSGTYQYHHSPWCTSDGVEDDGQSGTTNSTTRQSHSCRIHFSENEHGKHMNKVPCLLTRTGDKGRSNGGSDDDDKIGSSSRGRINQDQIVLIEGGRHTNPGQVDHERQAPSNSDNKDPWFLAALFDGHGEWGHVASYLAATSLPTLLLQALQQHSLSSSSNHIDTTLLHSTVQQAFDETDRLAMDQMPNEAGTTAVVVWQQGTRVHVASVGDSTAMVVQWFVDDSNSHAEIERTRQRRPVRSKATSRHYRILASAVKHKPGDPLERQRIEANGGTVYIPINPGDTSRVVYEMQSDTTGARMQMSLAMSRSLGDVDAKRLNLVSANCSLVSVDLLAAAKTSSGRNVIGEDSLDKSKFFVILASDGVMDMLDADTVINTVGMAILRMRQSKGESLVQACRKLLVAATSTWIHRTGGHYRDDMSLIVQPLTIPTSS